MKRPPLIRPFPARALIPAVASAMMTVTAAGAGVPATAAPPPASWTQYKFSANHAGENSLETTIGPGNVAKLRPFWTVVPGAGGGGLGGGFVTSPVVDGALGVVYANSQDGYIYALDAATGATLWTGYTGGYADSAPVLASGLVIVGSIVGVLAFPQGCSTPCAPIWTADTGNTYNPSLVADAGVVYAGAYDGWLRAFDVATGSLLWSALVNNHDPVFFAPTVANGLVYVTGDYGLYAFPVNCSGICVPLWNSKTDVGGNGSAAVVNGVAYLGIYDGTVLAIDAISGVRLWSGKISAGPSSPAVANGKLYFGSGTGKFFVFNASGCGEPNCKSTWLSLAGVGQALFDPIVANRVVYAGALNGFFTAGTVFAFPAECRNPCAPLFQAPVSGAVEAPVTVVNGVLYVATYTGTVEAFALPAP